MNHFRLAVFVIVTSASLETSWGQQPASFEQIKELVATHFKSNKEPTAKDAVWTSDYNFKVGVIDDGSRRDGYANYVCEMLHAVSLKGKGIDVSVIDIAKLVSSGKWITLGRARCE